MPLTIRWIQPSFICSVGKPPLPRRSMMLARVGNGDKFIVFGGAGVDTGPAALDPFDNSSTFATATYGISELTPLDFNDTYLLSDLFKLAQKEREELGLSRFSCNGHYN